MRFRRQPSQVLSLAAETLLLNRKLSNDNAELRMAITSLQAQVTTLRLELDEHKGRQDHG